MRTPITWIEKVTGVFVLIIFGVLCVGLFVTAQKHNVFGFTESHYVTVYLKEGFGLKKGSPVVLSDVDVGVVDDLKLVKVSPHPDRRVKCDLRIEGDFWPFVERGMKAKIDRQLIGGTRVELMVPTATALSRHLPPLANGDELDPEVPDSVMEKIEALKRDIQEVKGEVVSTLQNVQKTIENVRLITDGLATGKGLAGRFLQDEKMSQDVASAVGELRSTIEELRATIKNVQSASETVPSTASNVNQTSDKVNRLVDDLPKLLASVQRILADVEAIAANIRDASGGAPEVARKTDRALGEATRTIEGIQEALPNWVMPEKEHPATEYEALPRGGPR